MTETKSVTVALRREDGRPFNVDGGLAEAVAGTRDRPAPIGKGIGPDAVRFVADAPELCLSSSLLFRPGRSRPPVRSLHALAIAEIQPRSVELDSTRRPESPARPDRRKGPVRGLLHRHREDPKRGPGGRCAEGRTRPLLFTLTPSPIHRVSRLSARRGAPPSTSLDLRGMRPRRP